MRHAHALFCMHCTDWASGRYYDKNIEIFQRAIAEDLELGEGIQVAWIARQSQCTVAAQRPCR